MVRIPLEYFETAIAWLKRRSKLRDDFIAVIGSSRGGELALLLGAYIPEVCAVVGFVPSGVIHSSSEKMMNGEWRTVPSWTFNGKPLPYVQENNPLYDESVVDWRRPPFPLTPAFQTALRSKSAVERATIPVERTNGPLLMISGTDDQMWPSTEMADLAMTRLRKQNFRYRFEHLIYEGAGHLIAPPFAPTTTRHSLHPVAEVDFAFGGTAEADADAAEDSWPKVLTFLGDAAAAEYTH